MRRHSRRLAILAVVGALGTGALVEYAPHVLALTAKHGTVRPGTVRPPDDWSKKGRFLTAAEAYPSVVRVLDGDGSPYCSGTVVHSPEADLVITAAHCVYIDGTFQTGLTVAPGTSDGHNPYGTWNVDRIWVDPRYTKGGDERYDYAFLRVSRPGGPEIEDAVGANTLAVDQPFHLTGLTTTGYPDTDNPDDRQLTCALDSYQSPAHTQYREIRCGGYFAGVSGSPWVRLKPGARTGTLIGIIGGWNGGGPKDDDPHQDAISYSPYFDAATKALYQKAVRDDGGVGG